MKKTYSQQVLINDPIMAGDQTNSTGLLWYSSKYPGKLLEEHEKYKIWDINKLADVLEKYPTSDEWRVAYSDGNGKKGCYYVKKISKTRFQVEMHEE